MKQLVIALMVVLTLSGCGQAVSETTSTTEIDATATVPETTQAFYQPATMERETAGALRTYDMGEPISGIAPFGENLLVCTNEKTLSLLDGNTLEVLKQRELESNTTWGGADLQISDHQIGYFDASSNAYVILNSELVVESTTALPNKLSSIPVISTDFQTIYYASDDAIRAMDLSTGVSRIVRQEHTDVLSLEGLLFDNEVLRYVRTDSNGTAQTCFINTKDGSIHFTATYKDPMVHWNNWYAAAPRLEHPFGVFQRIITGNRDGTAHMLCPQQNWDKAISPGTSFVITQTLSPAGLGMNCYNLETGDLNAEITLPRLNESFSGSCIQGNLIWLWNHSDSKFYCWDMEKSAPQEPVSVLAEFTSVTDPQEVALSTSIAHAQALEDQYGIKIAFTEKGNRSKGLDYSTVPDYRPEMYDSALKLLEEALEKLPADFLAQVGKRTSDGMMQIHLVDDYDPAIGTIPGTGSCEFADGGVVINVSMCTDLETIFFRELGNAIITRISSVGDGLKNWLDFNPTGFQYSATIDQNSPYLTVGENYFMNSAALQSPRADQAQTFLHAMLPDQQSRFASEPMQAKLSLLCSLIRSTYDIPEETELPWEQYLQTA